MDNTFPIGVNGDRAS